MLFCQDLGLLFDARVELLHSLSEEEDDDDEEEEEDDDNDDEEEDDEEEDELGRVDRSC